jgi:hypothetical protein
MYVSWNASQSGSRLFGFPMTEEESESGEFAGPGALTGLGAMVADGGTATYGGHPGAPAGGARRSGRTEIIRVAPMAARAVQ